MHANEILKFVLMVITLVFANTSFASEELYHPKCLEQLHESDWNQPFNMRQCLHDFKDLPLESTNIFFRISGGEFESRQYARPVKESAFGDGWVLTTIPAETKNAVAVEYIDNGGGTAQMSSIFVFEKLPGGFVQMMAYAPFGDRCNDGGAELVSSYALGDDSSIVATNATPFRLINPTNRFNWRFASFRQGNLEGEPKTLLAYREKYELPELTNGWLPYDDLGNGANWCSGFIDWKYDAGSSDWQPLNVYVHKESFGGVSERPQLDSCINQWFAELIKNESPMNDQGYFKFNYFDWSFELEKLTAKCKSGEGLAGWFEFEG